MPTPTGLTSGVNVADQTSYDTASVNVTAGDLVIVTVGNFDVAVTPSISGLGATWATVISHNSAVVTDHGEHAFWAIIPSTTSGAITIDFGGGNTQDECGWTVFSFPDGDFDDTDPFNSSNTDSNSSSASSNEVTLGSAADSNSIFVTASFIANATPTAEPSYTELYSFIGNGIVGQHVQYGSESITQSPGITNVDTVSTVVGFEVKDAAAAGTTVTPGVVAATSTVPAPTVAGAAEVAPGAVSATSTVPTPDAVVSVTVEPATAATSASIPSPAVTGGALVTPAVVAATSTVPTPTLSVGVVVTPNVVTAPVTIPASSVSGAAEVTPAAVQGVVAVPTAAVSGAASVSPSTVAGVVAVPSSTVAGAVTIIPAAVIVVAAVPTPTILGVAVAIVAKQRGRFYRVSGRLALVPLGRSVKRGYNTAEGWEEVSSVFRYDQTEGRADHESAMAAVSDAWATHAGSAAATLKAAIDQDLQDAGFRAVDGSDLV